VTRNAKNTEANDSDEKHLKRVERNNEKKKSFVPIQWSIGWRSSHGTESPRKKWQFV